MNNPRRQGTMLLLAVAGVLAGLGANLIYRNVTWSRVTSPVELAISSASATGLVYPHASPMTPEREAERADKNFPRQLEESIQSLQKKFEADASFSPETAFWLGAGLVVTDRLPTARAAVDIARVHHPYDQDLWILDAILTEAEGEGELAAERLRTLLGQFPGNDLAARNLALLDPSENR